MADTTKTKRAADMRGFERRLAELESVLVWLVKNHDSNYVGRTFTIDEQGVDSEDAWRHARRLLGHKNEDAVPAEENYRDASEKQRIEILQRARVACGGCGRDYCLTCRERVR